jgi:hypothetical protein
MWQALLAGHDPKDRHPELLQQCTPLTRASDVAFPDAHGDLGQKVRIDAIVPAPSG